MALTSCPDCGREHSDAAPACPGCGRPNVAAPGQLHGQNEGCFLRGLNLGCGMVLVALGVFFVIFLVTGVLVSME
jgi:hypothetical protein